MKLISFLLLTISIIFTISCADEYQTHSQLKTYGDHHKALTSEADIKAHAETFVRHSLSAFHESAQQNDTELRYDDIVTEVQGNQAVINYRNLSFNSTNSLQSVEMGDMTVFVTPREAGYIDYSMQLPNEIKIKEGNNQNLSLKITDSFIEGTYFEPENVYIAAKGQLSAISLTAQMDGKPISLLSIDTIDWDADINQTKSGFLQTAQLKLQKIKITATEGENQMDELIFQYNSLTKELNFRKLIQIEKFVAKAIQDKTGLLSDLPENYLSGDGEVKVLVKGLKIAMSSTDSYSIDQAEAKLVMKTNEQNLTQADFFLNVGNFTPKTSGINSILTPKNVMINVVIEDVPLNQVQGQLQQEDANEQSLMGILFQAKPKAKISLDLNNQQVGLDLDGQIELEPESAIMTTANFNTTIKGLDLLIKELTNQGDMSSLPILYMIKNLGEAQVTEAGETLYKYDILLNKQGLLMVNNMPIEDLSSRNNQEQVQEQDAR